jgi:hypothetical protein
MAVKRSIFSEKQEGKEGRDERFVYFTRFDTCSNRHKRRRRPSASRARGAGKKHWCWCLGSLPHARFTQVFPKQNFSAFVNQGQALRSLVRTELLEVMVVVERPAGVTSAKR